MDLRKNIGQLFLIGFKGDQIQAGDTIVADIREHNLGGVILFDRLLAEGAFSNNIRTTEQLRQLTSDLQNHAAIPLFIAVDQEGGRVARLKPEHGFPATRSAAALGEEADGRQTASDAATIAQTLHEVGINLNLAPVVDLASNPDNPVIAGLGRSFSSDPAQVAMHAAAFIRAHRNQHVLTSLKHFPGHGNSQNDSHLGFTDISDTWDDSELAPYQILMDQKLADTIMIGHLFHHNLDPQLPATLSPAIISDLLRKRLGYDGVVISDDLQMQAITDHYSMEEAVCKALAAGIDLLIIGNNLHHDPHILPRLTTAVMSAVDQGLISREHLDQSCARIGRLKQNLQHKPLSP
ncbi:MAG: glycoside hydrolase family 3 protein [Desulfobulbaceae bacterium]|uniref:Glycoside hydrolase family 3 protein n=1 Tax=Candidatus Desulfatifera sulfidica TaxID=2841691 RepID=A0A8J6N7N2_9BACT|nr:glycoside hydrolase family 3 protein [Candidatus Desulfatifera sulfidica]